MIDQIAVVVKNKPGSLLHIAKLLSEKQVNILCISTYDAPDFGILRMIVDDCGKAEKVLQENGEMVMMDRVIAVPMEDEPGYMSKILDIMYQANISIDCLYSYISPQLRSAVLIFRAEDGEVTEEILQEKGYRVIRHISEL